MLATVTACMLLSFQKVVHGIAGLQGIFYCGTGCFHRRKVMYGVPPGSGTGATKGEVSIYPNPRSMSGGLLDLS